MLIAIHLELPQHFALPTGNKMITSDLHNWGIGDRVVSLLFAAIPFSDKSDLKVQCRNRYISKSYLL